MKRLLTLAAVLVVGAMVGTTVVVFWLSEWMDPASSEAGEQRG